VQSRNADRTKVALAIEPIARVGSFVQGTGTSAGVLRTPSVLGLHRLALVPFICRLWSSYVRAVAPPFGTLSYQLVSMRTDLLCTALGVGRRIGTICAQPVVNFTSITAETSGGRSLRTAKDLNISSRTASTTVGPETASITFFGPCVHRDVCRARGVHEAREWPLDSFDVTLASKPVTSSDHHGTHAPTRRATARPAPSSISAQGFLRCELVRATTFTSRTWLPFHDASQ